MPLTIYELNDTEKWDNVVHSFQNIDVYYLNGYVKAFQIHGDGEPYLIYHESDSCRGMNVVIKRDIAFDQHFVGKIKPGTVFDITTPYGYGGWLIEGEHPQKLFQEYEKWCRDQNIVSEFVRFHPVLKNHETGSFFYDIKPLGKTIVMDLSSKDTIWKNLTSKNRNMIRKAEKAGIEIYNGNYPEIYRQFRKIYNLTMDRDHAADYYYFDEAFYESMMYDLSFNSQVFYAELNSTVIAASIILMSNGKQSYHLSGSLEQYRHLAPTNLLLYKAALWGSENGCKTFHLGGGVGSREDSLFMFKKSFFRNEPDMFYIGRKIYMKEYYEKLINLRKNLDEKNLYFPKYRA